MGISLRNIASEDWEYFERNYFAGSNFLTEASMLGELRALDRQAARAERSRFEPFTPTMEARRAELMEWRAMRRADEWRAPSISRTPEVAP